MKLELDSGTRTIVEGSGAVRRMTTEDFHSLQGSLWNKKCLPTNFDGIYERNGHFMVIECKKAWEQLSSGQEKMLRAFKELNPDKVIVVVVKVTDEIYGDTFCNFFRPTDWQFLELGKKFDSESFTPVTLEEFRMFVREWEHSTYPEDVRQFNIRPYGTNAPVAVEGDETGW
jgi:hypothetical protein